MPIVDSFRVFGNGRYLGKTKTMSFCLRKSRKGDGRSGNRARREEEDDDGDCPARDYFRFLHSPDQVQFPYCRVLSELVVEQTDAPKIHVMEKSLSSRGSRRICRAPQPHTLSSSRTSRNLSPRYRTKRSQSSQPSRSKVASKSHLGAVSHHHTIIRFLPALRLGNHHVVHIEGTSYHDAPNEHDVVDRLDAANANRRIASTSRPYASRPLTARTGALAVQVPVVHFHVYHSITDITPTHWRWLLLLASHRRNHHYT